MKPGNLSGVMARILRGLAIACILVTVMGVAVNIMGAKTPTQALFTQLLMVVLGVFFMLMGIYATGIRGALSGGRGPVREISVVGRIILFGIGLVSLVNGLRGLPL